MNEGVTKPWIQEQVEEMAITHFQGKRVLCPEDRAIVKIEPFRPFGRSTWILFIKCPLCGRSGQFDQGT